MESLELLADGAVEVLGVLPYASNYTFLARVSAGEEEALAVYKPRRGERPLWDFPMGTLANREVAAFLVSDAAGFDLVPPTVLRSDGPMGAGSLQLFVEHDPEVHFFTLAEKRLADFAPLVAFDIVINNADRKSGHVIEDADGHLWALDHGVTFHADPKLRTVIWEFAEQQLPSEAVEALERCRRAFQEGVGLEDLLTTAEIDAARARTETLLAEGRFPSPTGNYPMPWPLV